MLAPYGWNFIERYYHNVGRSLQHLTFTYFSLIIFE